MESDWRYMWNKSIELTWPSDTPPATEPLTPTSPAENGGEQYWYGISSPTTVRSQPLTPSLDKRHRQESNQRPWWITSDTTTCSASKFWWMNASIQPHKCRRVNTAQPSTASLVNNTYFRFHKYIKLRNMLTNFSGTANPVTTANISTGALYLVLRTQTATHWTLGNWKLFNCSSPAMLINLINRFSNTIILAALKRHYWE